MSTEKLIQALREVLECEREEAEARKLRRAKPWWRYTLRTSIDLAALYCAFAIQFAASGSYAAAFITAGAVGLYGCWCFFDGSA